MVRYCATAECVAGLVPNMTQLGHVQRATRAADNAAWVSSMAGRIAAAATAAGNAPVAGAATAIGAASSLFEQMVRPNRKKSVSDSTVDMVGAFASDRYPVLSPAINELAELVKSNGYLNGAGGR